MPEAASDRLGLVGPSPGDLVKNGDDIIRAIVAQLEAVGAAFEVGDHAGDAPAPDPDNAGLFFIGEVDGSLSISTGAAWIVVNPKNAAAGTASLRTLGVGATEAAPGNHNHDAAYDASGAAAAAQAAAIAASQPVDADLTAIAALASAANKLPYATGANAWALTTLSAFIRTLLDDADAGTARATLGAAQLYHWGDGSDGAVTVNGSTTLTRDMFYTTLVVANGGSINTNGFRIFATTSITVQNGGTIHNNGVANTGGNGGFGIFIGGGAGGSVAGLNQAGAAGASVLFWGGGAGGNGGNAGGTNPKAGAAGGSVGKAVPTLPPSAVISAMGVVHFSSDLALLGGGAGGGSGGANADFGAQQGAGGGAGVVFLASPTVTVNAGGTVSANGGKGGDSNAGSTTGASGGGGGGVVLICTGVYTNNGTVQAAAGAAGIASTGGNSGTAGGAGTVITRTGIA